MTACPADIDKLPGKDGISNMATWTDPTATDTGGTASVHCQPESGSTFYLGDTTVTCTATDQAGNQETCLFTVTIQGNATM